MFDNARLHPVCAHHCLLQRYFFCYFLKSLFSLLKSSMILTNLVQETFPFVVSNSEIS